MTTSDTASDPASNTGSDTGRDIADLSFEEALAELEQIVRRLEAGDGTLDASITAFERGARLKAHCEAKLRDAQMKVAQIAKTSDGNTATTPFTAD